MVKDSARMGWRSYDYLVRMGKIPTRSNIDLASPTYTFDPTAGRYRSKATGRFVSEKAILSDIERYNETVLADALEDLTKRMLDGRLDLASWQRQMAQEIKDSFIVNLQVGRGGKNATSFSDYGRAGNRLRFQYQRLNDFAAKIQLGDLTPAQIIANARMYGLAPRTAFFDGVTSAKYAAGYVEERRVLNPAEHCSDCIQLAGLGWQPIGSLPEPGDGSTVCLTNDKCTKQYRRFDGTIE